MQKNMFSFTSLLTAAGRHTVTSHSATRHKWTPPALTPASKLVLEACLYTSGGLM